jgi:hypothetical protein
MEAIRLKATALDGKLSIAVPDSFNNQEVEVIVLMQARETENDNDNSLAELHRKRLNIIGKAPLPHFPITKYDSYNQ